MSELDRGDIVRHSDFGIGEVEEAGEGKITVAFRRGGQRTIQAEDVVALPPDGFWYEAYHDRNAAVDRLTDNPSQAIARLLKDFPNGEAQTGEIREHLEGFVEDWPGWWKRTQKLLRKDPHIDTSRAREKIYALSDKPRSLAEERYEQFKALRDLVPHPENDTAGQINPHKVSAARSVFTAVADGEELAPDVREEVSRFAVRAMTSGTLSVEDRTYLLLRLGDLAWLPEEQARSTLRELCQKPIRMYELDPYAQNRIIDAVLKHVGAKEGQQSLFTAFATSPSLMTQVCDVYLARGEAESLVRGLWIGLSENMADAKMKPEELRRWYKALGERLRGLGAVLHTIIFDANVVVDWGQLADCLTQLLRHLNKLDVAETVPEETMRAFVGLWRRSMAFAPVGDQALYLDVALAAPFRANIVRPILSAIFTADISLHLADVFVERIRQTEGLPLETVLDCIVDEQWNSSSEAGALFYLITGLRARGDVLSWATQRTVETVQNRLELLPIYLPVLDQLTLCDLDEPWREKVDGLRQRAFQDICAATKKGKELDLTPFRFDAVTHSGLQDFLADVETETKNALRQMQAQIEDARDETRMAEERLRRSEESLEELRRGYRQPDREVKLAERKRILSGISAMAAELERFALRNETGRRELTGVVRRLNSLLAGFEVVPFGTIGAEVTFVPSEHEFVGMGHPDVQTVTIVERGYMIRDLDGSQQVLKPAKVTTAGGDS